jgi:hypothetical protein
VNGECFLTFSTKEKKGKYTAASVIKHVLYISVLITSMPVAHLKLHYSSEKLLKLNFSLKPLAIMLKGKVQ